MQEALILAAGRGSRLDRPKIPKPLVDIGGRTIIFRLIKQLERLGFKKVHVVIGYERRMIRRTIAAHPWADIDVVFHENDHWQTGMVGSFLLAQKVIKGPFLLTMGDHVFDMALLKEILKVDPMANGITALVDSRLDKIPSISTALKVKTGFGRVTSIGWSVDNFDAVDTGLFAATPGLFDVMAEEQANDNSVDLVPGLSTLAKAGELKYVVAKAGQWNDVDTPVDVIRAEMRLRECRRAHQARPIGVISKEHKTAETEYLYKTPGGDATCIVVKRGIVSNPSSFDLVPAKNASSPLFVFSDETVAKLYGRQFVEQLLARGYNAHEIVMPDGEEAKTLSNYAYLVERVLSRGVDERSIFISLGGGVVCNVCGFVASTIYRGLELVHLPTTLMAGCDAAISHKQAINGVRGKNMVGSYYSPRLVAVDVAVLDTLTDRQIRDGLAEVIKHGLGQDKALADYLLNYKGNFRDLDFLEKVISKNIELKCELVKIDPKENAEAMVLQYGHTFGHPVEHLSGYTIMHGESVGIGMLVAAKVSQILGACDNQLVEIHKALVEKYGLPTDVPDNIRVEDILDALKYNKKYLTEGTRMALLSGLGTLWSVDGDYAIPVSDAVLAEAFKYVQKQRHQGYGSVGRSRPCVG